MNIDNMSLEELETLYYDKLKEFEKLFNSDIFIWLEMNKNIEKDFNDVLIKYKIYYYKKKIFILELEILNNLLNRIEKVLLNKYNYDEKRLTKKRFDKESIL